MNNVVRTNHSAHGCGTCWTMGWGWGEPPAQGIWWSSRDPMVGLLWQRMFSHLERNGAHICQKNGSKVHWSYIAILKGARAFKKPKANNHWSEPEEWASAKWEPTWGWLFHLCIKPSWHVNSSPTWMPSLEQKQKVKATFRDRLFIFNWHYFLDK